MNKNLGIVKYLTDDIKIKKYIQISQSEFKFKLKTNIETFLTNQDIASFTTKKLESEFGSGNKINTYNNYIQQIEQWPLVSNNYFRFKYKNSRYNYFYEVKLIELDHDRILLEFVVEESYLFKLLVFFNFVLFYFSLIFILFIIIFLVYNRLKISKSLFSIDKMIEILKIVIAIIITPFLYGAALKCLRFMVYYFRLKQFVLQLISELSI